MKTTAKKRTKKFGEMKISTYLRGNFKKSFLRFSLFCIYTG